MPKDGDKKRKKKPHERKRRLQLDDDKDTSYYRHFVTSTLADSSISTRSSTDNAKRSKSATSEPSSSTSASVDTDRPGTSSKNVDALTLTSSDQQTNETDNGATGSSISPNRAGSASPDPNCAICLGKLENKSFTDSCFHQFCFDCLVEWSKVKAECPLCKQPFKSIVHNVRSYNDYDQYHLPRPEERVTFPEHIFGMPGVRFRYRTTVTDHRYAHVADRIHREIGLRLLQRPSRSSPITSRGYGRLTSTSEFRRRIYLEHLQLSRQDHNTRRRVRETSPTFFQNNPAQTHRLVPWLNRELNALLQGGEQVAFILDLIIDLIKRYPIDSEEFYQHVLPYTGRNTRQFMREFMMFAKSPYHMAAYDRHCSYEPSNETNHDSDSESDDLNINVIANGSDHAPVMRSSVASLSPGPLMDLGQTLQGHSPIGENSHDRFSNLSPYSSYRDLFGNPRPTFPFDSPHTHQHTCLPPYQGTSVQTPAIPDFSAINWGPGFSNCPRYTTAPQQGPSTTDYSTVQTDPIICNETDSDCSSGVEIVDVEKPWHERSPIQLSSAEDSDSDVMITGMTYLSDPVKKEKKKKKDKNHIDKVSDSKREKKKRPTDSSKDRPETSRPSAAGPAKESSRSRSRSISPLRLTIIRSPDYQHKKFMYKTHGDTMETRKSGRGDHHLQTSSDSDSESQHVSITSHRHKSKSSRSSIEIVEYRKKKSKSKKSKKHKKDKKYDYVLDNENHAESRHHKKQKTHKSSLGFDGGASKSGHSSSGSHSKHKHKSKKKKHHKSRDRDTKSTKAPSMNAAEDDAKHILDIYTSDSDSDSDIDVETVTQKPTDTAVRGVGLGDANVEFVELNAAQAAVIDQELDHINKTLSNNDYIKSLMSDGGNGARKDAGCFENNDPNRLVNPDDVLNSKSFKKHPYGHKKSSKNVTNSSVNGSSSSSQHNVVNSISQATHDHSLHADDTIQISDISSCTDTDMDRQLPSFFTFSTRSSDTFSQNTRMSNPFDCHQRRISDILSSNSGFQIDNLLANDSNAYESPTSTELTGVRAGSDEIGKDNVVIDVDTLSNDSELDDIANNFDTRLQYIPCEPNSSSKLKANSETGVDTYNSYKTCDDSIKVHDIVASYRTCKDSIKINDNIDTIDVVNDSDNMNDEYFKSDDSVTRSDFGDTESRNDTEIDVENEDSDLECSLIEGHKTFEIDADSDNDVLTADVNSNDIDVVRCSDDDIVVEDHEENDIVSEGTAESVEMHVNVDSNTDFDSDCDGIKIATSPKANSETSQKEIDGVQVQSNFAQTSAKSDHKNTKDCLSDRSDVENNEITSGEDNFAGKENSVDKGCENANNCEISPCKTTTSNPISSDDHMVENMETNSSAASNTNTVTISPSASSLNWANQSLYESRPLTLSMSGSSDSVYQEWQSGTPEHYVIDSPDNVNLSPQGSPVSPIYDQSSLEWWDRSYSPNSHDGDFQPED